MLTVSKTSLKNVAGDSAVDAKKKIFRPIRVIQGVHKVLHTLNIFISQKPHKVETLHFRQ